MGAKIDKMKGTAQQIEGKLTGDNVRVAQGSLTRAKGDIEGAVARVARSVKRRVSRVKAEVRGRHR